MKAHNLKDPVDFLKVCEQSGFEIGGVKSIADIKVMSAISLL